MRDEYQGMLMRFPGLTLDEGRSVGIDPLPEVNREG